MSICKCCGHYNEGQLCEICGFIESSFSDIASSESNTLEQLISEHKKSEEYRETVLSHTYISIKANCYRWNATVNQYEEQKGHVELFDPKLNGTACYVQPVFSKEWIAHSDGKNDIKVEYTFGKTKKQASVQAQFEPKEGIWYLGLHIDESLQLEVLLGVMPVGGNRITETKKLCTVDLDFHT